MIQKIQELLREPFSSPRRAKTGSLLVVALWVISILSVFAISTGAHVRQRLALVNRLEQRNFLLSVAETGVYKVIMKLAEEDATPDYDSLRDMWSNFKPLFKDVPAGESGRFTVSYEAKDLKGQPTIRYGAEAEDGKINLNTVSAEVLSRLIQIVTELDNEQADEIAYAVIDWRDTDFLMSHPNYGAEDDYYEDLDIPYGCKDGPFQVLNELLLVRGVTREVYNALREKVTVYGLGAVNINTAPKEVFLALGISEGVAGKILLYRAGNDLVEATEDDRYFSSPGGITAELSNAIPISSGELAEISNLAAMNVFATRSVFFHIKATAQPNHRRAQLEVNAVAGRDGKIHYWHAGLPKKVEIPAAIEPGTREVAAP